MIPIPGQMQLPLWADEKNFWSWHDAEDIFWEVVEERHRQLAKWGLQSHPSGNSHADFWNEEQIFKAECEDAAVEGRLTWKDILLEEVYEALASRDEKSLGTELVQVLAVGFAWLEDITRRRARGENRAA